MHVYAIYPHASDAKPACFAGTLADAQREARERTTRDWWDCARIYLIDVPADKESLIAILNGERTFNADTRHIDTMRVWTLTRRGGLKEITE